MKSLLLFLSFIFNVSASESIVHREFTQFYDNEKIDYNKCGLNTKYFLTYLKENGVSLKNGYVISLHEDLGLLNHFMPRWGRAETYENGKPYHRSNWYFHVFAVMGDFAFDFSHESQTPVPLKQYLVESYLPAYQTENIFLLGKVNQIELLKKYLNLNMRIYALDAYEKDMGPVIYSGSFIELFNLIDVEIPFNSPKNNKELIPNFSVNQYGSLLMGSQKQFINHSSTQLNKTTTIYQNITLRLNDLNYVISGDDKTLCQALGHLGSLPQYRKEKELSQKSDRFVEFSCTLYNEGDVTSDPSLSSKCSFRYSTNNQYYNKKVIQQIGCTNLESVF